MGLKIIDTVSDNQGDQREYGVVEPDPKTLKLGDTGVGEQVVMKNKQGKTLLDLVIGKEVPDRPGLRYVRKAGEDGIYVVEVKTDKLSTKFEDWIERNLLQINSLDISRLWIRDYAIKSLREGLAIVQRGEMELEHNDAAEPKWKLIEDRKFVPDDKSPTGGHWKPVKMAANEELNTAKLDDLMTALDDLKIVDVSRKPKGLSADLKASADFASQERRRPAIAGRQGLLHRPAWKAGGIVLERGRNPRRRQGRRRIRPPLRRHRRRGRREKGQTRRRAKRRPKRTRRRRPPAPA